MGAGPELHMWRLGGGGGGWQDLCYQNPEGGGPAFQPSPTLGQLAAANWASVSGEPQLPIQSGARASYAAVGGGVRGG